MSQNFTTMELPTKYFTSVSFYTLTDFKKEEFIISAAFFSNPKPRSYDNRFDNNKTLWFLEKKSVGILQMISFNSIEASKSENVLYSTIIRHTTFCNYRI